MMRMKWMAVLLFAVGVSVSCWARISSAHWSTSLTQPLYHGVRYTLVLTIVTQAEEEIAQLEIEQMNLRSLSQSTEVKGKQRITCIELEAPQQRTGTIQLPETHAVAQVVTQQQVGFATFRNAYTQSFKIPAYTITFEPLPEVAKALPCGVFELAFSAQPQAIAAGGVTVLTVACRAVEGEVPSTFMPQLDVPQGCKAYPFTVTKQTPSEVVVKAYLVNEKDETIKLALQPMKVFDTRQRAVQAITAPAVLLSALPKAEVKEEELLLSMPGTGKTGMPIRYAPHEKAPILGVYDRAEAYEVLEEMEGWTRISTPDGEGWIERRFLPTRTMEIDE